MSLLWAVPPVALVVAMVIGILQLREIALTTDGLADQLRRLDEVRIAVAAVRAESAETRASIQHLRTH